MEKEEEFNEDNLEQVVGIPNYAPDDLAELTISGITEGDIIEAIKVCLQVSPLITRSQSLVNSVYSLMKALFIDNKKYVILEAPTGSGKTIIGFMSYFVVQYLFYKKELDKDVIEPRDRPISRMGYFLTSAKMLQEQIDKDLDRFDFREYICMLKGVDNYDCTFETQQLKEPYKLDNKGKEIKRISYAGRPCRGMPKAERQTMYSSCDATCPYQFARYEASERSLTVLNYAYYLNIMRGAFNPFFGKRLLTISDEAHLIPEIVCNIFNFEFTQFLLNQCHKLITELELNFGSGQGVNEGKELIMKGFRIFSSELNKISDISKYYGLIMQIHENFTMLSKNNKFLGYTTVIKLNLERIDELLQTMVSFNSLLERPLDIYYESEEIAFDKTTNSKVFKHIVRDLSESMMVRTNFLNKIDKGIFMSATLGNIDEFANMMGMKENEYTSLRLPSQFNFEKSPIYLCKSAWLNYNNFDKNIDKALMDTLKICNEYHPKEKGIIHTSTFKICNLLKEKINLGLVPDKTRFLFYQTADEKEKMVELMKVSLKPYIIVGPSLYEGLDLKDEQGRFNILIKVPYAGMSDYIKKKINRFPFWYNRNTLEKIVQAIGRTNRHVNDYSTTYLIDSCFDKLIYDTNEAIIGRLKNKTIY